MDEKENIHLFNQYLNELQLAGWKVFYEEQKNNNPKRAELYKTELANLYHNIWTTSTYQYYANETIDLVLPESKYTLASPKIPKLEDNDIAIYLNEITMEFHNYGFVRPEYEPFNFEYFEDRIGNLFSSEDDVSRKDKKSIEIYLKKYRRVQKEIDHFLKEFHLSN